MKKIALFSVFLLIFYGCQNNREVLPCNVNSNQGIGYVDGKIFTGKCNIFWNDSILWKQRTYKRGILHQEIGYYIPTGELEYIGFRKNNHIHGDFKSYYKNGEVSIEGELDQGKYIGEWNYYDDDGSLNMRLNYDKDGTMIDSIYYK